MSKEFDPANDPTSHLSRYLAFFQQPGINPDAMRPEIAKKFENPEMNLLDADRLLAAETVERVQNAVASVGRKMARNGVSGAHPLKYPESSLYGKPAPVAVTGHLPFGMANVNHLFGKLGGGFSPGDLQRMGIGPVGNEMVKTDFRSYMAQQIEERREIKASLTGQCMSAAKQVVAHDPGTKNFVVGDLEGDQLRIRGILDNHERQWGEFFAEKRLDEYEKDPFAACYSWTRRTGKTRLSMVVWEAIEKGCFFADTWIKPLYWAMFKRAPSIC
jgi:hypothetical protein